MKLFNIGLFLMIAAVIVLPVAVLIGQANRSLVSYAFYFCGMLELIGLIFVLVHIVKLKTKRHDQAP